MAIFHIIFLCSRETDVSEALGTEKGLKQGDSIKVKVPIVPLKAPLLMQPNTSLSYLQVSQVQKDNNICNGFKRCQNNSDAFGNGRSFIS